MTDDSRAGTRDLVRAFVAARDAGDWGAMAAMVTDDVEYVVPRSLGSVSTRRGKEAVDAQAGGLTGRLFDLSTVRREIQRITVEGDVAAVEQTMVARTLESGEEYANSFVWIYELRDGKIARLTEHADTLLAARVLQLR